MGHRFAPTRLWATRAIAVMICAMVVAETLDTPEWRLAVPLLTACVGAVLWWLARAPAVDRVPARVWLAGVAALALGLRVAWILIAHPDPLSDFAEYRDLGLHLCRDGQFGFPQPTASRPIGVPAVIALFDCVGFPLPGAFLGFNALVSTATIPLIFRFASRCADARAGKWATLLWALWPAQIAGCALVATEPLCTFTILLAIVIALDLPDAGRGWPRAVLVGILFAIASTVRSNALLLAPVWCGVEWLAGRRRRALHALTALGVAVVVLIPWGVRNQQALGKFTLSTTNGGVWAVYGNYDQTTGAYGTLPFAVPGETEIARDRAGYQMANAWIRSHPLRFLQLIPIKWKRNFDAERAEVGWSTRMPHMQAWQAPLTQVAQAYYLLMTVLLVWGAWRVRRETPFAVPDWIFVLFATWMAVHSYFPGDARYHAPLLPVYCALAGVALSATRAAVDPGRIAATTPARP